MLSDDEIRVIKEKVSKESGDWHFDTLLYARAIESAVIDKLSNNPQFKLKVAWDNWYNRNTDD